MSKNKKKEDMELLMFGFAHEPISTTLKALDDLEARYVQESLLPTTEQLIEFIGSTEDPEVGGIDRIVMFTLARLYQEIDMYGDWAGTIRDWSDRVRARNT